MSLTWLCYFSILVHYILCAFKINKYWGSVMNIKLLLCTLLNTKNYFYPLNTIMEEKNSFVFLYSMRYYLRKPWILALNFMMRHVALELSECMMFLSSAHISLGHTPNVISFLQTNDRSVTDKYYFTVLGISELLMTNSIHLPGSWLGRGEHREGIRYLSLISNTH